MVACRKRETLIPIPNYYTSYCRDLEEGTFNRRKPPCTCDPNFICLVAMIFFYNDGNNGNNNTNCNHNSNKTGNTSNTSNLYTCYLHYMYPEGSLQSPLNA